MKNIAFLFLCFIISCQQIAINTDPQGAEIYINGNYIGTSPTTTSVSEFTSSINIRVEKYGYRTQSKVITPRIIRNEGVGIYNFYDNQYNYNSSATGIYGNESRAWDNEIFFRLQPNKYK